MANWYRYYVISWIVGGNTAYYQGYSEDGSVHYTKDIKRAKKFIENEYPLNLVYELAEDLEFMEKNFSRIKVLEFKESW